MTIMPRTVEEIQVTCRTAKYHDQYPSFQVQICVQEEELHIAALRRPEGSVIQTTLRRPVGAVEQSRIDDLQHRDVPDIVSSQEGEADGFDALGNGLGYVHVLTESVVLLRCRSLNAALEFVGKI